MYANETHKFDAHLLFFYYQIIVAIVGMLASTSQATPIFHPLLKVAPVPVAVPIPVPVIPSLSLESILQKTLSAIWSSVIPAPIAVAPAIGVDQLLQAKLNLLLTPKLPILSPLPPTPESPEIDAHPVSTAAPVVVAPTSSPAPYQAPSAIPLASTKPFKLVAEPSNPSESASGSAQTLLSSYGVPVVSHDSAVGVFQAQQTLPDVSGSRDWLSASVATNHVVAETDDDSHTVHAAVRIPVRAPVHQIIDQQDQQYVSSYRLEDGTAVQEQGHFVPTGNGAEVTFVKQGHYEYRSPDGKTQMVRWVADQNGYRVLDN